MADEEMDRCYCDESVTHWCGMDGLFIPQLLSLSIQQLRATCTRSRTRTHAHSRGNAVVYRPLLSHSEATVSYVRRG